MLAPFLALTLNFNTVKKAVHLLLKKSFTVKLFSCQVRTKIYNSTGNVKYDSCKYTVLCAIFAVVCSLYNPF